MRYERKFKFNRGDKDSLTSFLLRNGFIESYPKRIINSLYYETIDYRNYSDSENGIANRSKIRIRFYNEGETGIQLEIKKKCGDLGYKLSPSLDSVNVKKFGKLIFSQSIYKNINLKLPTIIDSLYFPIVFIKYNRSYYTSDEFDLRITIDSYLEFCSAKLFNNKIYIRLPRRIDHNVLEIKYNENLEPNNRFINKMSIDFGLILERSSKYCDAIKIINNI